MPAGLYCTYIPFIRYMAAGLYGTYISRIWDVAADAGHGGAATPEYGSPLQ